MSAFEVGSWKMGMQTRSETWEIMTLAEHVTAQSCVP